MLSEKLDSYLSVSEVDMGSSCDKGIICIDICVHVYMCISMYHYEKNFNVACVFIAIKLELTSFADS